ncbi:MAG: sugar-binding transcriptional regulator [Pseudomonadota bacterium]
MQSTKESTETKLGDAARAAWLYYMARKTQNDIADIMGVSRQAVQRLVSLAVTEGLVRIRIDHPIASCLSLAKALEDKFNLERAIVVPSDPDNDWVSAGLADAGAAEVQRWLDQPEPLVVGLGTGRTLKAVVEHIPQMDCPQHKIVAMAGSIAPDGSAAYYNVIFSIADRVKAPHFPLPVPVYAQNQEERDVLRAQPALRIPIELAGQADVVFVGIADLLDGAPLIEDGFLTADELDELRTLGGVGEVCGWVFDGEGQLLAPVSNQRNIGPSLPDPRRTNTVCIAMGERKRAAIRAGLRGKLFSTLMTDERTASWLVGH